MAAVGLEVFYSTIQSEISSSDDAVVGLLHWLMINNGYICVGSGETLPKTDKVWESEKLPRDWNGETGVYCLLYRVKGSQDAGTFLLKIISLEDCLLVNLMRQKDNQVADISVNVRSYCTGQLTPYESVYKNVEDLHKKLRAEVLSVFDSMPSASNSATDRHPVGRRREPDGGEDPLREGGRYRPPPDVGPGVDPFAVGRGDLDPLSGGRGGGMFMDPARSGMPTRDIVPGGYIDGRLPRGSVPPGARYDPIGPPDLDTGPGTRPRGNRYRAGPDPDHMRPPDFDDNMFL